MPRRETLERAAAELLAGDARKAKDRLRGLLSSFPADLAVRAALADAYAAIGDPIQAGRWRYLREPTNDAEHHERAEFERWAHRRQARLSVLRWPPDATPTTGEAAAILRALTADAHVEARREVRGCVVAVVVLALLVVLAVAALLLAATGPG